MGDEGDFVPDDVELFEEELFRNIRVRELQNEDFLLATVERIVLRAQGCSVVLFYLRNNATSRGLRDAWNLLSERFAGINFFAVNASLRIDIMQAFQQVNDDPDHPLNEFRIRGFPTILVYREGGQAGLSWPKAFYNGSLSTDAIQDWILQLACVPGYKEVPAIREGVVMDNEVFITDDRVRSAPTPEEEEDEEEEADPGLSVASATDFQSGDFRIDEEVIDSNLEFQDDFEQEVIDEGLDLPGTLDDLDGERPIPERNLASFQTTDYPGSLEYGDPGFLEMLEDRSLGIGY